MSRDSMNAFVLSSMRVAHEQLVDPIGDPARVEPVLPVAVVVVEGAHAAIVARGAERAQRSS